jgi:hypothetical protein
MHLFFISLNTNILSCFKQNVNQTSEATIIIRVSLNEVLMMLIKFSKNIIIELSEASTLELSNKLLSLLKSRQHSNKIVSSGFKFSLALNTFSLNDFKSIAVSGHFLLFFCGLGAFVF